MKINLQDSFNKDLPADPNLNNSRRQVYEACFSYVTPRIPSNPRLIHVSEDMLNALGLTKEESSSKAFGDVFSGKVMIENSRPYAMCYGGHQFGHWAGQLGDGRAINLGEVLHNNQRWTLQLKGAGETPYSRSADGLAVLRSSIREHLCSEAMYHLGVPTTRSLSLMLTGDEVWRDIMYDGNAAYEKGAVICRVAPSFIRFGNYQILAARGDKKSLKQLIDYTIKYFFPSITQSGKSGYVQFFNDVALRTLEMIVHWQRVGFVHGVMNTDNMSILGLTIDYGPYGWLEGYDHNWTPNTTDKAHRRYRYGHQPAVALWNLVQLANALMLIVEDAEPLQKILDSYQSQLLKKYNAMMHGKLGMIKDLNQDQHLMADLEEILQIVEVDMTIFFRNLSQINKHTVLSDTLPVCLMDAFYDDSINNTTRDRWLEWLQRYIDRLKAEDVDNEQRVRLMKSMNPKYVLRNYMAQMAIEKADLGDFTLIDELYMLLRKPYEEQREYESWFAKRPEWARSKVGCSMLSCSS